MADRVFILVPPGEKRGPLETLFEGMGYRCRNLSCEGLGEVPAAADVSETFFIEAPEWTSRSVDQMTSTLRNEMVFAYGLPSGMLLTRTGPPVGILTCNDNESGVLECKLSKQREVVALYARLMRSKALHAEECRYREILVDVMHTTNSSLEPDVVFEVVLEKIKHTIQAEGWSLLMLDEARENLVFKRVFGQKATELEERTIGRGKGIAGWVVDHGEAILVNDVSSDPRFSADIDKNTSFLTKSLLCAPLISRGKILGVVEIINKIGDDGFTAQDLNMMKTLLEPAGIAIENAYLFEKIRSLSITDDLTQLYNSRYFNETLTREVDRSRRYGGSTSLIFLDLDNFKNVNDRYGHLAGSQTLREVAPILAQETRRVDILCRYGGDEFTAVLPETDEKGSHAIAQRMQESLSSSTLLKEMGHAVQITASFGVATYPLHAETVDDLIHKADAAMYHVKMTGKNNVCVARDGMTKGKLQ